MKHKTEYLEGARLDLAVDLARSIGPTGERDMIYPTTLDWSPSTNWADGGPIIERERIELRPQSGVPPAAWFAFGWDGHEASGATPLIAAMRTYVASKFGDEVDLP